MQLDLVGRPTQLIFISDIHLDDQHRNANMNDKDHLVGQLTNLVVALKERLSEAKIFASGFEETPRKFY